MIWNMPSVPVSRIVSLPINKHWTFEFWSSTVYMAVFREQTAYALGNEVETPDLYQIDRATATKATSKERRRKVVKPVNGAVGCFPFPKAWSGGLLGGGFLRTDLDMRTL